MTRFCSFLVLLALPLLVACGDDGGTDADFFGVGAQCSSSDECDVETEQACLPDFQGGYCGIEDCTGDIDCVEGSACVAHTNGTNYCFRSCVNKDECNVNRDVENQSNCSANIVFVDTQDDGIKACVPPSA